MKSISITEHKKTVHPRPPGQKPDQSRSLHLSCAILHPLPGNQVNLDHPQKKQVSRSPHQKHVIFGPHADEVDPDAPVQEPVNFHHAHQYQANFDPYTEIYSTSIAHAEIESISILDTQIKLISTTHTKSKPISLQTQEQIHFRIACETKPITTIHTKKTSQSIRTLKPSNFRPAHQTKTILTHRTKDQNNLNPLSNQDSFGTPHKNKVNFNPHIEI